MSGVARVDTPIALDPAFIGVLGSARSECTMLPVSSHADRTHGCAIIWRPWDLSTTETQLNKVSAGGSRRVRPSEDVFHHPARLFLPRSRMQEYLSHLGRTVLASFPVQATLHFYNDEDSSSEEEDVDEEADSRCRLVRRCDGSAGQHELSSEP